MSAVDAHNGFDAELPRRRTPEATVVDLGRFKIAVSELDSDISRQVMSHGWYADERYELSVFESLVRPGMLVLDAGANVGFYTLLARSVVGESGTVIAFEPYPPSAALLRRSIEVNGYTNVHLLETAIADASGTRRLHLSPAFWTEHSILDLWPRSAQQDDHSLDISVTTIDVSLERLGLSAPADIIKLDIEGAEHLALKGMLRTLKRSPRVILFVEFWPNGFVRSGSTPRHFLNTLDSLGFSFQNIDHDNRTLVPVTIDDLMVLVDTNATRSWLDNAVMNEWGWYTNLLCQK